MNEFVDSAKRLVPDSFRQRLDDWGIFGLEEWGSEGEVREAPVEQPIAGAEQSGGILDSVVSEISNLISPQQAPEAVPQQHIVQSGDTLFAVAEQYGLSLEELASINPQIEDVNKIGIGDSINIATAPSPVLAGSKDGNKNFGGMAGTEMDNDIVEQDSVIELGTKFYVGSESPEEDRVGWAERAKSGFKQIAEGTLPKEKEDNLNRLLEFTEKALPTAFSKEMETIGIDAKHIKQMVTATYAGETNMGTNVKPSGTGAVGEMQVTASTFKSVLKQGQFGKKAAEIVDLELSKLKKMSDAKLRKLLSNNTELNFLVAISKWMQLLKTQADKIEKKPDDSGIGIKLASSEDIRSGDKDAVEKRLGEISSEIEKEQLGKWDKKGSQQKRLEVSEAEGGVLLSKDVKPTSPRYGNFRIEDDGEVFQGRSLPLKDTDLDKRPKALDRNFKTAQPYSQHKNRKGKISV